MDEGFDINYTTVCNYIKKHTETVKEAYVRQEYQPGEICEFDCGYVHLTIDGRPRTVQMAAFTSAKGNYRYANLYHSQKIENFFDVHVKFFNEIEGVYQTVVYDNMKVAVKRFISGTQKKETEDLLKLSLYYGFQYQFCNICSGNEKPYLLEWRPSYDTARTSELRVNKYAVVSIDENKYSVPDDLVGRFVFAKVYPEKILLYHQEKLVAEHLRSYGAHTWSINIQHYFNTIKKKPGSLHSSTAMQQMNPTLQSIYNYHYTENPKDFIDLLELYDNVKTLRHTRTCGYE